MSTLVIIMGMMYCVIAHWFCWCSHRYCLIYRHGGETYKQEGLRPGVWGDPQASVSSVRCTPKLPLTPQEGHLLGGHWEKTGGCWGSKEGKYFTTFKLLLVYDIIKRYTLSGKLFKISQVAYDFFFAFSGCSIKRPRCWGLWRRSESMRGACC